MVFLLQILIALACSMAYGVVAALSPAMEHRLTSLVVAIPINDQYAALKEVHQNLIPSQDAMHAHKKGLEKLMRLYEFQHPELKEQEPKIICKEGRMLKQLLESALLSEGAQTGEGIAFWTSFELIVEESAQKVQPQNILFDLLLNVVIVSGEQFAQELFSADDKVEQQKLMDRVKKIAESYKATETKMQLRTGSSLKSINQNFVEAVGAIQKSLSYTQALFGQEVSYIQRLINLSIPPQLFVILPVETEHWFKASSMPVPNSTSNWYNIFPVGDWQFDDMGGFFVQRGLNIGAQPDLVKKGLQKPWSSSPGADTDLADQNQIFTDYFTSQSAYQVQTEITLIQNVYPFFAGMLFNRARWLSGSPDRMFGYRLVGLYGSMSNGKPTIGLYLGQTQMTSLGGLYTTTTPLQQIASGKLPVLYTLEDADVRALGKDPSTFRLTVLTQESSVSVTLEKKEGSSFKELYAGSVSTLDPAESTFLFWYHGVGFMSPGCQAAFKILQPKDLASGRGGKA